MTQNKLPSLDKSKSSSKTETENTLKLDTRKISISSASSDDKNMEKQEPKVIMIKTNKLARDDQSFSSVYVSIEVDRIPREKKEEKLSETSIAGNKITQDLYNMSKEAKMGSSIDETKILSILTLPPYTNKQDYKGSTNDKTRDSHTRETSDSPSDPDSCARNLDEEHKNEEDDDYIDPPSKKKIILILNYKKKSGIGYYYIFLIKSNQFVYAWHWQPWKGYFSSWLQKQK